MRVKNIFVSDKKLYLDILIRELIKCEISYVLIDNYEIHFDDFIVRFYEKCEIIDLEKNAHQYNTKLLDFNNYFCDISKLEKDRNQVPRYTKKLLKQQNRMYSKNVNTKRK